MQWRGLLASALILGGWVALASPSHGQSPAPVAPATAPQGEPVVLGRFNAVSENGRTLAEVQLKDILALVLERNLGLRATQVSQGASRQILIAAEERLQTNFSAGVGSQQSIAASLTPTTSFASSPAAADFNLLSESLTTLNAGIARQDWYGNTYSLNYQEEQGTEKNLAILKYGGPVKSGGSTPPFDVSTLTASATFVFAQNSGHEFNRIPIGQAQVGVTQSVLTTRLQEQSDLSLAATAYWSLVGQLQIVAVLEDAVRLDQRLVNENQLRVTAGTRVPADVQASQTQLALDQRDLLTARLQAVNLEDQLRVALGLDTATFGFKPVDVPGFRSPDYDPAQELQRVYSFSPVLATLQSNLVNKSYDVIAARNSAKPTVNLGLSYGLLGYGSYIGQSVSAYGYPNTSSDSATLTYAKPVLDRVGPAVIAQRLNEQHAIELQVQDERNQLSIQLQTILRNIRLAEEQIAAARVAVELAQTQLDNEVKRLSLGASTPFTVAQIEQQLSQARQVEIAARVQFEQNDMARLVLTGEVYRQYGLTSLAEDTAVQ